MPIFQRRAFLLALLLAVLLPGLSQAQRPAAGQVMMLTGKATALSPDGTVRTLAKQDSVYSGDLLSSGVGSYVNLRLTDGGFFLLKPETRFAIENYSAAPSVLNAAGSVAKPAAPKPSTTTTPPLTTAAVATQGETSRAFFRLFKGGFRSVSGLIGKVNHEDYRVSTPVATIGIRGTRFGIDLCEGACQDRADITEQLQRAGTETNGTGLVQISTLEEGGISVETATETVEQQPGSVLFTTENGDVVPGTHIPASILQDMAIQPAACGGG